MTNHLKGRVVDHIWTEPERKKGSIVTF